MTLNFVIPKQIEIGANYYFCKINEHINFNDDFFFYENEMSISKSHFLFIISGQKLAKRFFPCSIEHTQKGHCSGNYKTMCSDILWICIQIIILLRFHEIFLLFGKLNFVTQIPWNRHGIKILVAISEFFWPQYVPSSESLHIHAPVKSERRTILFEVCQM